METTAPAYVRQFVGGYIEAALWSSINDNGEPLDSPELGLVPSKAFEKRAKADCIAFIRENGESLKEYAKQYESEPSFAGHDFWLTRNEHGAGFWDRGLEAGLSKRLTDSARASGEVWLYVYRKKVFQA